MIWDLTDVKLFYDVYGHKLFLIALFTLLKIFSLWRLKSPRQQKWNQNSWNSNTVRLKYDDNYSDQEFSENDYETPP